MRWTKIYEGFEKLLKMANEIVAPDRGPSWDDISSNMYRQTSNISRMLVGNKLVDHSDV